MDINIRNALIEDAENLTDCLISCWSSAYRDIVPDDFLNNLINERDNRIERWKNNIANPGDCEHFCITFDDRIIGWLTIHKVDGEVWAIYLLEEFRGKGFGKYIMNFALTKLKSIGHKKVMLWVFEDNLKARYFYEKIGFHLSDDKREMTYGIPLMQVKYICEFTE